MTILNEIQPLVAIVGGLPCIAVASSLEEPTQQTFPRATQGPMVIKMDMSSMDGLHCSNSVELSSSSVGLHGSISDELSSTSVKLAASLVGGEPTSDKPQLCGSKYSGSSGPFQDEMDFAEAVPRGTSKLNGKLEEQPPRGTSKDKGNLKRGRTTRDSSKNRFRVWPPHHDPEPEPQKHT
jgi:hypothetical protein